MFNNRNEKQGFAIIEIILALAFWSIVFPSILLFWFSIQHTAKTFPKTISSIESVFYSPSFEIKEYVEDRNITVVSANLLDSIVSSLFQIIQSDWPESFGVKSCRYVNSDSLQPMNMINNIDIGLLNKTSAIEVRNGYVYLATNSSTTTDPDFFVIDSQIPENSQIIASIDTGPGLSSIHLAGFIAYVGNTSTKNQLQAIDIRDPRSPRLLWTYTIPGANSASSPLAKVVYFYKGLIFLGTEKTTLAELSMIDVSTGSPILLHQYEIGAGVNDLFVSKDTLYVASPLDPELLVFDISDHRTMKKIGAYEAPGSVGNGKRLDLFNDNEFYFGRTVGGDELNILKVTASRTIGNHFSQKIRASIDGLIASKDMLYLLTSDTVKEFQIWKKQYGTDNTVTNLSISQTIDLPVRGTGIDCDGEYVYISLLSNDALRIFKKI